MKPPQRPIDWRPSVREDDPSQEHPELGISCPGLSLPYKDVHCGQGPEREHRKKGARERERGGKREETSCSNNPKNAR